MAKLDPGSCLGDQVVVGLVEGSIDGANLFLYITPAMPSAFDSSKYGVVTETSLKSRIEKRSGHGRDQGVYLVHLPTRWQMECHFCTNPCPLG